MSGAKAIEPGSSRELLPLALPIFFSQAIDVAMIFCDRYFVSSLGKEQLAATLTGAILAYLISTLLVGTFGQLTPLVSQYRGAGQSDRCVSVVHQGFFLAVLVPPVLLILAYLGSPLIFQGFGHEKLLYQNEMRYFHVMMLTVVTSSIRQVFANFFIGIGRSTMVTVASVSAVLANVPLAYALIFGAWGFPRLEIEGAAWATVIASNVPIVIYVFAFFSPRTRNAYHTARRPRLDMDLLRRLLRYGFPAGLEMLVNVSGFLFLTMVMYSYSADVAAATTIVLNWDMVSFLPLLGISQAVGGLVGKYLGAGNKEAALRSAWSSLKLGWAYASFITITYFTFTVPLISVFAPGGESGSYSGVLAYASVMLKISCVYFFFDATYAVLGGILKGAGDTLWTMLVSNSLMWTCSLFVLFSKERLGLTPVGAWIVLTCIILVMGILYAVRFLRKSWLDRLMIGDGEDA